MIAAIRGKPELFNKAMQVLYDASRQIILSEAVRLEVMPKPFYQKRQSELELSECIFENSHLLPWKLCIPKDAYRLACRYGISAREAIHLAFAVEAKVNAFVASENPTPPLLRFNQARLQPRIRSLGKP